MEFTGILGAVAACLTTGSFLPQAVKSWRSRSTEDISLIAVSTLFTGQMLWLSYGFAINDYPLIGANFVSGSLTAIILYVKIFGAR